MERLSLQNDIHIHSVKNKQINSNLQNVLHGIITDCYYKVMANGKVYSNAVGPPLSEYCMPAKQICPFVAH